MTKNAALEKRIQIDNMETAMAGYSGCNWKDEYKGYSKLTLDGKIGVLEAALEEQRRDEKRGLYPDKIDIAN